MADIKEIYVYENWKDDIPGKIGTLYAEGGKGKEVISFAMMIYGLKMRTRGLYLIRI